MITIFQASLDKKGFSTDAKAQCSSIMFRIIPNWVKTGQADNFREFSVGELLRCTQRLAYQQMIWPGQDNLFGTFCFETVHLSRAVYEHLKINAVDGCVTTLDHDLFDWLRGRDRDAEATTTSGLAGDLNCHLEGDDRTRTL